MAEHSRRTGGTSVTTGAPVRSVVITGVSTGIGLSCAERFLARGYRVFGSVRRAQDAEALQRRLGDRFVPLIFDVTDTVAVQRGAAQVATTIGDSTIAALVNNAGIAVPGPLLHLPLDEFRHQIEVNLTAQLAVTQAFAPLLGVDRDRQGAPGRIVMISSQSGKAGPPFLGPYAASKHALEGMSESLRRELMPFGIDVIIIGPGQITTPIWDKAEALDLAPYSHTPYVAALERLKVAAVQGGREQGLPVIQVADLVVHTVETARPKVRYAITPNPLQQLMMRILPKRLVDRLIAKRLGLLPAHAPSRNSSSL